MWHQWDQGISAIAQQNGSCRRCGFHSGLWVAQLHSSFLGNVIVNRWIQNADGQAVFPRR